MSISYAGHMVSTDLDKESLGEPKSVKLHQIETFLTQVTVAEFGAGQRIWIQKNKKKKNAKKKVRESEKVSTWQ